MSKSEKTLKTPEEIKKEKETETIKRKKQPKQNKLSKSERFWEKLENFY